MATTKAKNPQTESIVSQMERELTDVYNAMMQHVLIELRKAYKNRVEPDRILTIIREIID